jgi:hypothetical protein
MLFIKINLFLGNKTFKYVVFFTVKVNIVLNIYKRNTHRFSFEWKCVRKNEKNSKWEKSKKVNTTKLKKR